MPVPPVAVERGHFRSASNLGALRGCRGATECVASRRARTSRGLGSRRGHAGGAERVAGRLRVFVSSTMRDLANERDAVCRKLEAFNLEPVNAEGMLPTGQASWERLRENLVTSDLLVLI